MFRHFPRMNWLAILLAASIYYMLGALWGASPLGEVYHDAIGFSPRPGWSPDIGMYIAPLLGCTASSIVTAILAQETRRRTFFQGIELGLLVGLGYSVAVAGMDAAEPQNKSPVTIISILSTYHLIGLSIVGGIVTSWQKRR